MTTTIQQASQRLNGESLVTLFTLDASAIGGGIYRWAGCCEPDGSYVRFGGLEYPPMMFKVEGFEWNGNGDLPRPQISTMTEDGSELGQSFMNLAIGYKGGQSATLYRIRTLARYLDGHEDEGRTLSEVSYVQDIYLVDRLISLSKTGATWELITPMDHPYAKLPSRQALRDACTWVYRKWNGSSFEYDATDMACPYAGTACFDKNGNSTDPAHDECGHMWADCLRRFNQQTGIPFGGFPALDRVQS